MLKTSIVCLFAAFSAIMLHGQKSIQQDDIEIYSQLTLLTVSPEDIPNFERDMNALSKLSKQVELEEEYDWLAYKSDTGQYLIVNFSSGIADALTLDSYRKGFHEKGEGEAFDVILDAL